MNESLAPRIPQWLAQVYPETAALGENPLYLALTGEAYCQGKWYRKAGKNWLLAEKRRANLNPLNDPLGTVWAVGGIALFIGLSWLGVPGGSHWMILLPVWILLGHFFSPIMETENEWTREARAGRLLDFHLSMSAQEIADAMVASRTLPGFRGYYLFSLGMAASGAVMIAGSCLISDKAFQVILWLIGTACVCGFFAIPAFTIGSINSRFRSLGQNASMAALDSISDRGAQRLKQVRQNKGEIMLGCVMIVAGMAGMFILMAAGFATPAPGRVIVSCLAAVAVWLAGGILASNRIRNFPLCRRRAITQLAKHLPEILERHPTLP